MTVNLKKLFKYLAASVFAALIFVCFSGFTLTGSAKIRYSGKGTAAFSVISDAAEQEVRIPQELSSDKPRRTMWTASRCVPAKAI